jgi:hypothetical protein
MEQIARHIETLLRRHDYVVVPDLGGFVVQNQQAVIHADAIEPPLSTVGFNPLLNVSDGMLTIEISRAEKISFREASHLIEKSVAGLKSALKAQRTVSCGNLGTLSVDAEEKIIFKPSLNADMLPSNYGLGTLHYSPFAESIATEDRKLTITLPSPRKIARYAAIGLIAASVFLAAPTLNDARQNFAGLYPENLLETSEKPVLNNINTPTPLAAVSNTIAETKEIEATPAEEARFHVVVASLPTQEMADKYCTELKADNFSKVHILRPSRLYRVAIESFTSKDSAVTYMENLRKSSTEFAEAWVLCE